MNFLNDIAIQREDCEPSKLHHSSELFPQLISMYLRHEIPATANLLADDSRADTEDSVEFADAIR